MEGSGDSEHPESEEHATTSRSTTTEARAVQGWCHGDAWRRAATTLRHLAPSGRATSAVTGTQGRRWQLGECASSAPAWQLGPEATSASRPPVREGGITTASSNLGRETPRRGSNPAFVHTVVVHYSDCDMQGIVFNANYWVYVDHAIDSMMRTRLGSCVEEVEGFEMVLKKCTATFVSSARFKNELEVALEVSRFGTTSFDVAVTMTCLRDDVFARPADRSDSNVDASERREDGGSSHCDDGEGVRSHGDGGDGVRSHCDDDVNDDAQGRIRVGVDGGGGKGKVLDSLSASNRRVVFRGEMVYVTVSRLTWKPIPLPQTLLLKL